MWRRCKVLSHHVEDMTTTGLLSGFSSKVPHKSRNQLRFHSQLNGFHTNLSNHTVDFEGFSSSKYRASRDQACTR